MLSRRIGTARARGLAASSSLGEAQHALTDSSYRRDVLVGQTLAESEYGLAANLLWQLRVLAGWQPPTAAGSIRILAGGFEVANICAHDSMLSGAASEPLFHLGGLGLAWSRLRATTSRAELRSALARSAWGDPGGDAPADIAIGVQLAWAHRVAGGTPGAREWALGGAALLVARRLLLERQPLTAAAGGNAARLLGATGLTARNTPAFVAALPVGARWALSGVASTEDLWRAEFGWWSQVERDGLSLLTRSQFDAAAPIGAIALLAADVWRCRAALQLAAGGGAAMEVYDALV
jgi:hypothetical protein